MQLQRKTNRKSRVLSIGTNINDIQDPEGHSPTASFFKWHFSYRFAVVDKISTDTACSRGPSAVAKLLVISKLNTERQRSHDRPTSSTHRATSLRL